MKRVNSTRSPGLVIACGRRALAVLPKASLGTIGVRCPGQVWNVLRLPGFGLKGFFGRWIREGMVQPTVPIGRDARGFHCAGIDDPAPRPVSGLVVVIAECIFADGISRK